MELHLGSKKCESLQEFKEECFTFTQKVGQMLLDETEFKDITVKNLNHCSKNFDMRGDLTFQGTLSTVIFSRKRRRLGANVFQL